MKFAPAGSRLSGAPLGVTLAVLGTFLFGLNASTTKIVMATGITPGQIVGFRSLFTAVLAGIAVLLINPRNFKVRRNEILPLLFFGVFGVALMQWSYSVAVQLLPVGIALLIEYTAIVWVPLASFLLFRERFKPVLWVGVALVLVGLAVVSQVWASNLNPIGILAAFGAAAFLSVYFIMGERTQQSRDAYSTLFYTMLISAIMWSVINPWWVGSFSDLGQSVDLAGNLAGIKAPIWLLVVWIGIAGSFLPMLFSYLAMRLIRPAIMGIIGTSEVLFAFLFGWLWLGETIGTLQAIGGLLVIAGIVIAQISKGKPSGLN